MMTGFGQFGPIEMGGMFSVVKVRSGLEQNDYKDPGWYKQPEGKVAYEWQGKSLALQESARQPSAPALPGDIELKVRKPGSQHGNH
jgi:hypothetical protein